MAKILIVYESKYGQTEKISKFIGDRIRKNGHDVDLIECHAKDVIGFSKYDGVLVGGAIYARGFPRRLRKWVHSHAEELNKLPSSFFSVCLGVLQKDPKAQLDLRNILHGFYNKTNWYPKSWKIFAGALNYSRYNWITKRVMQQIAKRAGSDTDVNKDYEYTDWSEVADYADSFVKSIEKQPRTFYSRSEEGFTSLDL